MNGESKGARVASGDLKMQRILKHLTEPTGERQRPFGTRLCLQSLFRTRRYEWEVLEMAAEKTKVYT